MVNVIVGGTIFGVSYIEAVKSLDQINLVGILAGGSKRSKLCAEKYGVPLYTAVEDLPEGIDIAFVIIKSSVLGGQGTNISKKLLARGIHVMQEHPIHYREMEECYQFAAKFGRLYQVGNLYNSLPSIRKFILAAGYLNKYDKPVHADIMTSSQGLYTLIDLLNLSLPDFRALAVIEHGEELRYPFHQLILTNGNMDIHTQIHNEVSDSDGNNHMHLLHKMIFFYESGRLELEDTFGSVVWRARMNISDTLSEEKREAKTDLSRLLNFKVFDETEISVSNLLTVVFIEAIQKEINKFLLQIESNKKDIMDIQRNILVAKKWGLITEKIGFPRPVKFEGEYLDHVAALREIR